MFASLFASFASIVPVLAEGAEEAVEAVNYVITTQSLQPVGNAMIDAATAAIPVGVSVMCVTFGVPVAKKIIKQLGR